MKKDQRVRNIMANPAENNVKNESPVQENKMGVMPVGKLLFSMSLPIMISMLVQALYNVVDSMFVARVSENALTALSMAFPIQNLMIAVSTGLGVGLNAVLSRALGAKDEKGVNRAATNGIMLLFICGLIFMIGGVTIVRPYFEMQTDIEEIVKSGIDYTTIVMVGSMGVFMQILFERLLQSTGRTLLTMISQGTGAIINIIFDPIFIFGLFGFPKMGVAGAAYATILGQWVAAAIGLVMNIRKNPEVSISMKGFRPHGATLSRILSIGIPSVVMQSIGSVMTFLMNKILITYHSAHETAATAFGVYFKLNSFIFMPVFGMNNGIIPIVAYNYGAQNRRRMMETIKRGTLYASCIMVAGTILFQAIPGPLLSIFDATDTMMAVGIPALRIISLSFCMAGACIALGSSFQALGKSLYSMVTSIVRQLVFLVPIAYVLARYGASVGNDDLVWWCYPIAEIASLLLTLCFFRHVYKTMIAQIPEGRA